MKVLLINIVFKEKSTGRTHFEIKRVLEKNGHYGFAVYGKGKHHDENTYRIGSDLEYYFHNIMARITGLQGYFSFFATKRLIGYIRRVSPDIIHLGNLHANYLNLPLFFQFLKNANIPVIMTLHDCWTFTGKCPHYTSIQCFKWKTCCFKCPVLNAYPQSLFFDRTKKLYIDKRKWLSDIKDLTVIGVSKWISEQAKMSFLSNRRILTIYNWIDRDVFRPREESILSTYEIDTSKFIILGVSASWNINTPRFEDFMKLSSMVNENTLIVLIGHAENVIFPSNIKHIPFIKDVNELSKFYSSVNVYVHLSIEDTFGKVVAEAMACGTPVIVYNSTALPELVAEGCGYVVEPRDVHGITEALYKIRKNGKKYYTNNCVLRVAEKFDYYTNIMKLIELYESTIA